MLAFSYNHFRHILTVTKIFVWWGGVCPYVVPMVCVCVSVCVCACACVCVCCQTEQQMGTAVASQMADPNREDEQVTLLGEEGLRAGGQALKLGYDYMIFFSYVVLVLNCCMLYYSIQCNHVICGILNVILFRYSARLLNWGSKILKIPESKFEPKKVGNYCFR